MSSLPTCRTWIFSAEGLLLSDWLLSPTRPVDLTARWSGITKSAAEAPSSLGFPPRHLVQVLLYFGLPLLPVITLLFVLVNLFSEAGLYYCQNGQKNRRWHPQTLYASYSVITLCLLTGVECVLSLVPSLPRYMPMWPYTFSGNKQDSNSHRYTPHSRMNKTHWESGVAPRFLAQLPAVVTMQAVIRLVMIWTTIGLLGNRIRFISHLQANADNFIHFYLSQLGADVNTIPVKSSFRFCHGKNSDSSMFHCSCSNSPLNNDCSVVQEDVTSQGHRQKSILSRFRLKDKACILISCLLYTTVIVIVHLVLYLPQMWSFRIEHVRIQVSANQSQVTWVNLTGWRLINGPGQPVGEYCMAIFGLVLPVALLVLTLLLLSVKLVRSEGNLRRQVLHQSLLEGYSQEADWDESVLPTLINSSLTELRWNTCLILSLGAIFLLFWLPRAITWQIHRISCLLHGNMTGSVYTGLSWPPQIVWLWSELANLGCNFVSQLVLMISRSCSVLRDPFSAWQLDLAQELDPTELAGLELETVDEVEEEAEREIEDAVNGLVRRTPGDALTDSGEMLSGGTPNSDKRSQCLRSNLFESDARYQRHLRPDGFYTGSCDTPCVSRDSRRRLMISPLYSRKYNSNQYLVNSPFLHRVGGLQNIKAKEGRYHPRNPPLITSTAPNFSVEANRVLLTYSPRSRHPFRPRRRAFIHDNVSMSPMSDPRSTVAQWRRSQSPPPLPPPPIRRRFSMIGDSSVYSTPHASPKLQLATHVTSHSGLCSPTSNRVQFVEASPLLQHADSGSVERDVQI